MREASKIAWYDEHLHNLDRLGNNGKVYLPMVSLRVSPLLP